jgi:hypothetical protein
MGLDGIDQPLRRATHVTDPISGPRAQPSLSVERRSGEAASPLSVTRYTGSGEPTHS